VAVERGDVLKVVGTRHGEVFACTDPKGTIVPPPPGTPGL
jgi:hypothetical protein